MKTERHIGGISNWLNWLTPQAKPTLTNFIWKGMTLSSREMGKTGNAQPARAR
ncbi:hypothetical protein PCI56_02555 [Plesiomonas shigelloides subsp. oncorhynchi]|nr:hypothetical protein [Plesiomonas shigelloides]